MAPSKGGKPTRLMKPAAARALAQPESCIAEKLSSTRFDPNWTSVGGPAMVDKAQSATPLPARMLLKTRIRVLPSATRSTARSVKPTRVELRTASKAGRSARMPEVGVGAGAPSWLAPSMKLFSTISVPPCSTRRPSRVAPSLRISRMLESRSVVWPLALVWIAAAPVVAMLARKSLASTTRVPLFEIAAPVAAVLLRKRTRSTTTLAPLAVTRSAPPLVPATPVGAPSARRRPRKLTATPWPTSNRRSAKPAWMRGSWPRSAGKPSGAPVIVIGWMIVVFNGSSIVCGPVEALACMMAARSVHWSPTSTGLASQPASAVLVSGRSMSVVLTTKVAAATGAAAARARTASATVTGDRTSMVLLRAGCAAMGRV